MSSTHEISVASIARDTVPALATPALSFNEDSATFHDLAARIATAVKPAGILEDIQVRDVVDLIWDVVRGGSRRTCSPWGRATAWPRSSTGSAGGG